MKKPVIFIVSLGCAKNWLDTEVMAGSAVSQKMQLANEPDDANIYLINTCSFISDARSESDEEIEQALKWKREKKGRHVVIAGCLTQRAPEECSKKYPDVDLFLGLNDVPKFAELVAAMLEGDAVGPNTEECTYLYDENTPRLQLTPGNFAYVKIAEGCNHTCAFCAIPAIRGRQRSRTIDSIVKEADNLLDQGVCELVLIAQDTTGYGKDLNDGSTLSKLIKALDKLEGEFWIRILYTHPDYFSDEMIDTYATSKHLVPYIDIPLQHIADPILKDMRRNTPARGIRELVNKLKTRVPNVTLRTTFIVGYPGETEQDFLELKEFIRDAEFDRLGVFTYSPEEGTKAHEITENLVPKEVAEQRRDELMEMQAGISLDKNEAMVGKKVTILMEGMVDDDTVCGRSAGDAPEVDQLVYFRIYQDCELPPFVEVVITEASEYDMVGELA